MMKNNKSENNKMINNMMNQIIINEKINLQKILYLYSLTDKELFKYCKNDKDDKDYTKIINILSDYIINGTESNHKLYVKNNCNRYYCNNSLQSLQKDIRNFIYPDNTYDYDIKNCASSIMLYLSKINNLNHTNIEYYVNNRDLIIEKYNTSKEDLKNLVIKLSNIDNPYKTCMNEIDDFINEYNYNKKILIEIYKNKLPNKNYNKKNNPISSKYCEIFYYFESEIVLKVINKFKEHVICYMFDGFNTNKQLDLNEINQITKEYGVEWINKPIETKFNFDEIITYDDIKSKLEKHIYKDFQLYDISDTYYICEKYNKYIKKTIKYCNDLWYVLDNNTNLWKCVKEVQPYFIKILRIGLTNKKIALQKALEKEKDKNDDLEDVDYIKKLEDQIKIQKNNFIKIDKSSFCNQFKKNITSFINDNNFDNLLDKTSYIFAFKNGIYNIKNKTFRNGIYPTDYLTKTLNFDYEPYIEEDKIKWIHDEITKICNMNVECKDYYLSILAYALCGDPSKYPDIYCLIGQSASNGKSKFVEALVELLPIYAGKSNVKVFESTFEKKHKFIINFSQYRLLYLNEFDEKKLIDSQIFKEIGDGETISNEVMHGTTKELNITAKPFIMSNYTPKFDKQDKGVERRYKHLQFNSIFSENYKVDDIENLQFVQDSNFKNKILDSKNEIINILFDYANNIYLNGLPEYPEEYKKEKKDILSINNEFSEWINFGIENEEIENKKNHYTSLNVILNQYNKYANENNFETITKNKVLIDKMKQLCYKYDRQKMINGKKGAFEGIKLIIKSNDEICISDSDSD